MHFAESELHATVDDRFDEGHNLAGVWVSVSLIFRLDLSKFHVYDRSNLGLPGRSSGDFWLSVHLRISLDGRVVHR